ncbi:hypothetical protein JNB88_31410 [Rhizobium cauense]|uniref:hypothetical protein n=1 Tax=Rhizobium cauense TaxID=1166683 RepID=UPI001C6E378C|nr:hypothetical protein [Rhizobium cauense]MBW9118124.1 hypothetical protein [Rhizobium cauense]
MPDPNQSPAVQSLKKEEADQRRRAKSELDKGLQDTFPASDPISITSTAVSAGRADASEAERVQDGEDQYPLVNEALRSVENSRGAPSSDRVALAREAARLSERASEVASGAVHLAKGEARSVWKDVEDKIRERPLTAVGVVATIAFFWGATR